MNIILLALDILVFFNSFGLYIHIRLYKLKRIFSQQVDLKSALDSKDFLPIKFFFHKNLYLIAQIQF